MIPLQPPDEEKTLVYVLIKKPDEIPAIMLPKAASTQPSKPEVYFIRYKTQVKLFCWLQYSFNMKSVSVERFKMNMVFFVFFL